MDELQLHEFGRRTPSRVRFVDLEPELNESFWKSWIQPSIDSFKSAKRHKHAPQLGLKRELKNRHIQMIAFGSAIGTGLFIDSGGVLAEAGPASLLIAFILVGTMLFNVVMALVELTILYPVAGSFSVYATRFIDPAWGFAMGWNYALNNLIILPLKLTVCINIIDYWGHIVDSSVWITIFLVTVLIINLVGVRGYGEAEFVFSSIKMLAILGFIILAILINIGGAPNGRYYGIQTWTQPGSFHNGFKGFCSAFIKAAFAYSGTEIVGLTAAESDDPRKTQRQATKQVFWRIWICYIVSLFLVGLLVPYTHPNLLGNGNATDTAVSPFVITITDAGINVLPSIFNGVIIVAVFSVGNSSVYASSRTIAALSENGQAPKLFGHIDRKGRPITAIALALMFAMVAYINDSASSAQVFNWLMATSGLATIFTWMSICWAHIRFRQAWKEQDHSLEELPFRAVFGVVGSWYGLIFNLLILVAQFYVAVMPVENNATASSFFQAYLTVPVVLIFYIFWKLYKRTPFMITKSDGEKSFFLLRTATIDLETGRSKFDLKMTLERERAEFMALPAWKRLYIFACA